MSFSNEEIKEAVLKILKKYDDNGTGYIEGKQRERLVHDMKLQLKVKKQMTQPEIAKLLQNFDKQSTGKITKDQIYFVLRQINP